MERRSNIAWTEYTWNPWQGCTKVSEECRNCHMYRDKSKRNQNPAAVERSGDVTFHRPYRIESGSRVFTCSHSDFFHEGADAWRREAWAIIRACSGVRFIILTKRPERIAACLPDDWKTGYPNVCLGITAGNQRRFNERWAFLKSSPAEYVCVSHEPALGMIDYPADFLTRGGRAWVIAGGETGGEARASHLWWFRHDRDQCKLWGVPFFFKAWGEWIHGVPENNGYRLQNGIYTAGCQGLCPDSWQVREWQAGGISVRGTGMPGNNRMLDGKTYDEIPEIPVVEPQISLFFP